MSDNSYNTRKCPICGANIEVTEFEDGSILIRRDCICDLSQTTSDMNDEAVRQTPNTDGNNRTDIVKSSQLGFEVPEDEAEV